MPLPVGMTSDFQAKVDRDRQQAEAARLLVQEGAGRRTTAAESAVGRLEGLEGAERARASQAAGQLMAQATGGVSGAGASGAILAAGEEAGRQAETQYATIAGRAAKDIFAAETALGEAQMEEAETMKATTESAERSNKILAYTQTIQGLNADIEAGADEAAAAYSIVAMMEAETDPFLKEWLGQQANALLPGGVSLA